MSEVDEIKDRLDIIEVVGETVKLRKSGKNYSGFCPFHPNTRTPAFVVFPDTGTWRCFGACNDGGDIFKFVMKKEGWDFREALENLARRAGVTLQARSAESEAVRETHDRVRGLLEAVVAFYRHNLLHTPAGEAVLKDLHARGLGDAILEEYEIGYAPDSWEQTLTYLKEKGFDEQDLTAAGMVSQRETGGVYDRFRHRVMIPIRDGRGRMAGFGARVVDPEAVPKYLNSPQTALFDKSRMLYGLDRARKAIRSADQAVIVEGYMDVIGLAQAGHRNAVSPMGTALTGHQLRYLKRYSRNMILALDADAAGNQATLRGLDVARESLDREFDPVFDARGLVRHEGRLDAELRVVTLPPGMDPDELVADDPQAWPNLLAAAQPIVQYVMDLALAGADLDDPKAKAEIARQVLPLIEDVADSVEREAYRQSLARKLQVDERALLSWRSGERPVSRPARRSAIPALAPASVELTAQSPVERFCLGLLLRDPELIYRVNRQFNALELDPISVQDFSGTERQMIFQAVSASLSQDEQEPNQFWRRDLHETILQSAERLASEVAGLDLDRPKVQAEVISDFLRLRRNNLERDLQAIQFRLQSAQDETPEQDGGDMWALTRQVQRFTAQLNRLSSALGPKHRHAQDSMVGEGW